MFKYTRQTYGPLQAEAYHDGLHHQFALLGRHPTMGQAADEYLTDLRKLRYKSHIIFYSASSGVILIEYLFHIRKDVRKHMFDNE